MPWPNSGKTGFRWGIGPYFVFPTTSWHGAGDGAWQLGPAFAFGYRAIPHLVISALFHQATSFAYTSLSRKPASFLTIQPMITYEFARDWYAGSKQSTWKIDFRRNTSTTMPLSATIGKIWKLRNDAAINTSLSGEWMVYRQFASQEETVRLDLPGHAAFPETRTLTYKRSVCATHRC